MTRQRQRGLTMIELIFFIVMVGVAVVGVLHVINQNVARSADPIRRKQAMAIAESLMDEVRSTAFTYCDITDANAETAASPAGCAKVPEGMGTEANAVRPFDNVNDYGSADGKAVVYKADAAGTPFPEAYAAAVTVAPTADLGPAGATVPAGEALRIVVTVTYGAGDGESVTLESYRTRFAPNVF